MAVREIGVGIVGFGLGGRVFHAPFVDAVNGLRLAAILQRKGDEAAKAHPTAQIVRSFDEMLAKIVQDRDITPPDGQDALVAAKQMHLNELAAGFGHPGYRPELFLSNRQATSLPEPLRPDQIGLLDPDLIQKDFSLCVIAAENVDPAECSRSQTLVRRGRSGQLGHPGGIYDHGDRHYLRRDRYARCRLRNCNAHCLKSCQESVTRPMTLSFNLLCKHVMGPVAPIDAHQKIKAPMSWIGTPRTCRALR